MFGSFISLCFQNNYVFIFSLFAHKSLIFLCVFYHYIYTILWKYLRLVNVLKQREITLHATFAHFDLHAVEQFPPPVHFHCSLWKSYAVSDLIVIAIVVEPYDLLTIIHVTNSPYHCLFIDFLYKARIVINCSVMPKEIWLHIFYFFIYFKLFFFSLWLDEYFYLNG